MTRKDTCSGMVGVMVAFPFSFSEKHGKPIPSKNPTKCEQPPILIHLYRQEQEEVPEKEFSKERPS